MPLLVGLIFVAVFSRTLQSCFQPSISAYYYTPVRPVFVAGLCAIGSCLILYRGRNGIENSFLNFSGFMAFIVAFEPTEIGPDACDVSNQPFDAEIYAATQNNILSLYIVGTVALLVGIGAARYLKIKDDDRWARIWGGVLTAVLAVGLITFLVAFQFFARWGHLAAAVLLFAGIIVVVGYNCYKAAKKSWQRRAYGVLALLMILTVPILFSELNYKVLIVEAVLIALFAVYWIIQTIDIEQQERAHSPGSGSRNDPPAPGVPARTDKSREPA